MSIRTKTLLIVSATITMVVMLLGTITSYMLLDGLNKLEINRMKVNVTRVREAYNVTIESLKKQVTDYAMWDDSYTYITDHNENYVAKNITGFNYQNLNTEALLFMDLKGSVVYGNTHILAGEEDATVSSTLITQAAGWMTQFAKDPEKQDISGIIQLPEGPLMFSAQPILHGDGSGPASGLLLFGKYLDVRETQRFSDLTKLDVSITDVHGKLDEHEYDVLQNQLTTPDSVAAYILDRATIEGHAQIQDVNGDNALFITVKQRREFYLYGLLIVRYLIIGLTVLGIVTLLVILKTLEKNIISPVVAIRNEVYTIGKSGTTGSRLKEGNSGDELDALRKDVNTMLASLEQTQGLLSEEKGHAQNYLDIVSLIMVVLNSDGTIRIINTKGAQILGYSVQELIGKNWFDLCIPQRIQTEMKIVFGRLMNGEEGLAEIYENPVVTRDGRELIISWHNAVLRDANGTITGTVSSGDDITTEKQENVILQKSEERFRTVVEQTGQIIYDYNVVTGHIDWIGAIQKVTGYTPDEYTHVDINKWGELIHPEDREKTKRLLEEAKKNHKSFICTYRFQRKDGSYAVVEDHGTYIVNDQQQAYRMLGAMADVTERSISEQQLVSSEARFKTLFEYIPEAVYVYDYTGTFIDGNIKTEEITGYTRSELIGQSFLKLHLLTPESIAKSAQLLLMNVQGKPTGPDVVQLVKKSGEIIDMEVRSYPFEMDGKKVILGMSRDVTHQKQADASLAVKVRELERANELMIGRELKMVELKKQLEELRTKLS